jgi:4-amino-4-deoxy-L-arabinose transferase-like glycosyltransferase
MTAAPAAAGPSAEAPSRPRLLLFWLVLAACWFGPLDVPHLFEPDEGRYAEIPREMVASGDWVTPRLNDIKYFEKPALQYWATAAAFKLFGQHAWTARLWPSLSGFLGLLLTFWLARSLFDTRTALLAVLIQAGALLYLALGRFATVDMSLCFGLQLSSSALALLARQRRGQMVRGDWPPARLALLLGLGLGVAVLSKGLVGILIPGAVAVLYLVWRRDWTLPLRARPWWSLLLLLVLAAPWFLLVSARNPEFAHFFFVVQHFQRYLSSTGFDRYQPAWFFAPVLILGFLPWATLLPGALLQGWRDARAGLDASAVLLVWTLFVLAFFSASQSKLIPYILPLMPALSLLAARHVTLLSAADVARHLGGVGVFAGLIGVGVLVLARLPAGAHLVEQASSASIALLAGGFLLLAASLGFATWLARRLQVTDAVAAAAFGAALLAQCLLLAGDRLPRFDAIVQLEQRSQPWIGNSTRIYCVHDYLQPLPFYWRRPCTLVGYRGELDFGLMQEPWRWIPDLQGFAHAWAEQSDALAILPPEDYQRLSALGLPMRVIYTSQSLVAVVRR